MIQKESLEDSEFNHIFVTPNHYGNETGDVAAAEFYERPTFLKTLRSTDEATLRREVPVATWVRNSTILTRNYHKLGNQINPYQLFQSVSRRQKLLQAAYKFNTFMVLPLYWLNKSAAFDNILLNGSTPQCYNVTRTRIWVTFQPLCSLSITGNRFHH